MHEAYPDSCQASNGLVNWSSLRADPFPVTSLRAGAHMTAATAYLTATQPLYQSSVGQGAATLDQQET